MSICVASTYHLSRLNTSALGWLALHSDEAYSCHNRSRSGCVISAFLALKELSLFDLDLSGVNGFELTQSFICLDTHMLCGVYQESGICVRNHCGAEPPRDIEPPGLVTTVGWRDRASTSYAAADRVKAPASAARGRFRRIHGGRTAPCLPAEA